MIVSDFADGRAADLIETGIANMPDGGDSVLDQGHRENARHALEFGIGTGDVEDFVVRHGDGFTDAFFGGAGLPLQPAADAGFRDARSAFARSLAAYAIDNKEDAAVHIAVHA